jgi:hypothetical protein
LCDIIDTTQAYKLELQDLKKQKERDILSDIHERNREKRREYMDAPIFESDYHFNPETGEGRQVHFDQEPIKAPGNPQTGILSLNM